MLFQGWDPILRIALSTAAVYVLIVAALRVAGSTALAKLSGYDMIVTAKRATRAPARTRLRPSSPLPAPGGGGKR